MGCTSKFFCMLFELFGVFFFAVVTYWTFEYDNVTTLEIRFFLFPYDFSKLFLQRLYSFVCSY